MGLCLITQANNWSSVDVCRPGEPKFNSYQWSSLNAWSSTDDYLQKIGLIIEQSHNLNNIVL